MSANGSAGWRSRRVGRLVDVVTAIGGQASDWAELDACVAEAVAAGRRLVVVDLSGLQDVPTEVLGALVRAHRRLGWRNGNLAIVSPRGAPAARSVAALDGSLDLYETFDEVVGVV
jgi:phage terminase large subunit-like protein